MVPHFLRDNGFYFIKLPIVEFAQLIAILQKCFFNVCIKRTTSCKCFTWATFTPPCTQRAIKTHLEVLKELQS